MGRCSHFFAQPELLRNLWELIGLKVNWPTNPGNNTWLSQADRLNDRRWLVPRRLPCVAVETKATFVWWYLIHHLPDFHSPVFSPFLCRRFASDSLISCVEFWGGNYRNYNYWTPLFHYSLIRNNTRRTIKTLRQSNMSAWLFFFFFFFFLKLKSPHLQIINYWAPQTDSAREDDLV